MINLTSLVLDYKQKKDKTILDKIFFELKTIMKQKAKFIYYHKWYPLNLYHSCIFCRNCKKLNNVPKREHNIICKDCDKCKCIKGFFNLKKDGLCDLEDVENDIWLEVLRVIDNFNSEKDFNIYLFSCLWEFIPSFITKNFVKSLLHKSLTKIDEEGNETEIEILDESKEKPKLSIEEILKVCKTKKEKELINLFISDKSMNQQKAGEIMGKSQQSISLILNRLQKKLRNIIK